MRRMCQNCGKKEASFYYKSVVNGRTNEVELCSDCAAELGYTDAMKDSYLNSNFFDLLQPDFGFGFSPLLQVWDQPLRAFLQPAQAQSEQFAQTTVTLPRQEQDPQQSK